LTSHPPGDAFLAEYIIDVRDRSNNELIYAEQVDLSDLHSIRKFATKWVDNAPPRRLDMIILCAGIMAPPFVSPQVTSDGLEASWGINYLANFHLLGILSPALRAQPADRDVRVIMATCSSYLIGDLDLKDTQFSKRSYPIQTPWKVYGASKLALMMFAKSFQKHLDAYERPDKQPNNAKVVLVDPGWTRSPGMRRWLSCGSIFGLLIYVVLWPIWWLFFKSSEQGAQSFLYAAMEESIQSEPGGVMLRECRPADIRRAEINNEEFAKELWEYSDSQVEALEKEGAKRRARERDANSEKNKEKAETENDSEVKLEAEPNHVDKTESKEKAPKRKEGSRRSRRAG
jgi:NAD(P)-dependent dehydrogenase (short-subunit alcohol dehydrogenase family)